MQTTSETKTSQAKTLDKPRASHAIRLLRAATLAVVLATLGAWLGFC